ncbi:MAG: lysophospholipase [Spirochaetaceae bacterium]|nr:lysophospholipase [Spirochaetaceae bacterium]
MKKDTIFLKMSDNSAVAVHRWVPDGEPVALIQISHGMAEHALRYDYFGTALTARGFAVYAHDHRGHGDTAGSRNLGYLADKEGFERVTMDLREVIGQLKKDFPEKKGILFGHSFGSFISQNYIERFGDEIDGCILSGSAGPRLPLVNAARFIAGLTILFKGKRHRSPFLQKLAFGGYNKRIENPASENAWLSRDAEEVRKYDAHDYDGFLPTAGFFYDLFTGLSRIHRKKAMEGIPRELPVFIFAGTADPVGDYGRTVKALADIYRVQGLMDVTLNLYPEGRHEMLNEINKDEVIRDIIGWIEGHI